MIKYRENTFALTMDSQVIHEKHNIMSIIVICAVVVPMANNLPKFIFVSAKKMIVTHISSLKDAATIVQQEASYFNVAHRCSSQKGSLTNLHIRRGLTLTTYTCMYTTVVHPRALDMH